MAKFDADATVFEPIEVVFKGKTYSVGTVTTSTLEALQAVGNAAAEKNDPTALQTQLAMLLDVDASEFDGADVRVLRRMLTFVSDAIADEESTSTKKPKRGSRKSG